MLLLHHVIVSLDPRRYRMNIGVMKRHMEYCSEYRLTMAILNTLEFYILCIIFFRFAIIKNHLLAVFIVFYDAWNHALCLTLFTLHGYFFHFGWR